MVSMIVLQISPMMLMTMSMIQIYPVMAHGPGQSVQQQHWKTLLHMMTAFVAAFFQVLLASAQ